MFLFACVSTDLVRSCFCLHPNSVAYRLKLIFRKRLSEIFIPLIQFYLSTSAFLSLSPNSSLSISLCLSVYLSVSLFRSVLLSFSIGLSSSLFIPLPSAFSTFSFLLLCFLHLILNFSYLYIPYLFCR